MKSAIKCKTKAILMKNLKNLRSEIDKIDIQIAKLLEKRLQISEKIFETKKNSKIKITDKDREKEILEKFTTKEEREVFKTIIKVCKKRQFMLL